MKSIILLIIGLSVLAACVSPPAEKSARLYQYQHYYDGQSDDLLTAGLGLSGLRGSAPQPEDPLNPTAAELRRGAYYHNFKALNDLTDAGGYGRLYGITQNQAPISGHEYWSLRTLKNGSSHTVVLQYPDNFNKTQPCLVAAPSSGSRNVFGAVGTSGSWALLNQCAVVYTDKGTGTAVRVGQDQRTYDINGQYLNAAAHPVPFSKDKQEFPDLTIAMQHAHSKQNPEASWGLFVLDSIRFSQAVMARVHGVRVTDVTVIAASLSNGGGAVIRAAEQDQGDLIDAVVAAEPQIYIGNVSKPNLLKLQDLDARPLTAQSLFEYSLNAALYEPCAALSPGLSKAPFAVNLIPMHAWLQKRCELLKDHDMLSGEDTAELAQNAYTYLLQQGTAEAAMQLLPLNTFANLSAAITTTYANSYAQAGPKNPMCGVSFAHFAADGKAAALSENALHNMFSVSSGIAPTPGIELAVIDENNSPQRLLLQAGYGFDAMRCFWQLEKSESDVIQAGVRATSAQPHMNKRPTILLHGRSDATVQVNHSSRAYYARHRQLHGRSQLRYYEITHVQHFDAFLSYPGMNQQFVPMHPYFEQALDLMWLHLQESQSLPSSQIVLTKPRGLHEGQVPALQRGNIPAIQMVPDQTLEFVNNTLVIPE